MDIRDNKKQINTISLDELLFDNSDRATLADTIASDFDMDKNLLEKEEIYLLYKAILKLTNEEQLLIQLYLKNLTQSEIGREMNISQAHVSRRLQSTITKLKNILIGEDL